MSGDQVLASHAEAGTMSSGAGRPGDCRGPALRAAHPGSSSSSFSQVTCLDRSAGRYYRRVSPAECGRGGPVPF